MFGRRGLDEYLQNQRSGADLEEQTAERTADIEAEAQATATALREALAPLLQPESETVRVSSDAAVASKDAATAANDAAIASRDAATVANAAVGTLPDIVEPLGRIETVSETFSDIVDAIGAPAADLRAAVEGLSHLDLAELARAVGNFNLLSEGLRETFEFVFSLASEGMGLGPDGAALKDELANTLDGGTLGITLSPETESTLAAGITLSPETESTLAAAVSQGTAEGNLDMGDLTVDPSALTAKIEDAVSMFSEPAPPSGLTADTISVSGNTVHVSGEIVRSISEGLQPGNRNTGGLSDASQQTILPEGLHATIQMQFPDGSITELTDQIVRLRDQDRVNL